MFRVLATISEPVGIVVAVIFCAVGVVELSSSFADALFLLAGALVALVGGRVLKKTYEQMNR